MSLSANDFVLGSLTGTVFVRNGYANINIKTEPRIFEGNKSFVVRLRRGAADGPVITETPAITIQDNSEFVSLTPNVTTFNEGDSVQFTLLTANAANNATLYFSTLSTGGNVDSQDFFTSNSGEFVVVDNSASIVLTANTDFFAIDEGDDQFKLQIRTQGTKGNVVIVSNDTIQIKDTSNTFRIESIEYSTVGPIIESESLRVVVRTVNGYGNAAATLYYTTTGNADIYSPTSGEIVINENYANIEIISESSVLESEEKEFTVQVREGSVAGDIISTSSNIIVKPYLGKNYSVYFDGTGDGIYNVDGAGTNFGTGDFTMECWFYPISSGATAGLLIDTSKTGVFSTTIGISYKGSTKQIILFHNGTSTYRTATTTLDLNQWHHVALIRASGSLRIFLNGIESTWTAGATTLTANFDQNNIFIGRWGGSTNYPFSGFIADARVVNGTAVYTSNFTVPSRRLEAITNTSILTCQFATIQDYSGNDVTLTVEGDAAANTLNPYGSVQPATSLITRLAANAQGMVGGGSCGFDILTIGATNGEVLYYNSIGELTNDDLTNGNTGSTVVTDNGANIIFTAVSPFSGNSKRFGVEVRRGSVSGTVIANTSPEAALLSNTEGYIQATGGTIDDSESGYRKHIFDTSNILNVSLVSFNPARNTINLFLVGGGGHGGVAPGGGGGGGAGGFISTNVPLAFGGEYVAGVGAGGAGYSSGSNSQIFSYVALGGGAAGRPGQPGGSGGGGGAPAVPGGTGIQPTLSIGSGNPGGNAVGSGLRNASAGGGGGATEAGIPGSAGGAGGRGGNGLAVPYAPATIGGSSTAMPWPNPAAASTPGGTRYFAGGGGSGSDQRGGGPGGQGGGGAGNPSAPGVPLGGLYGRPAIPTSGGGGGGGGHASGAGGAGGSGVIIIRYPYA